MLVDRVAVDLDELLEDGGPAAGTLNGEASRVVKVAVNRAVVLVVRVVRAEDGRADLAGKVLDVELHVCARSDWSAVSCGTMTAGYAHREP
jgi:hypothetical protein